MIHVQSIDHPAIAARDLEKLTNWYCEVLGFEKFFRHPERPVWMIKAQDGSFIEMMQQDENPRPQRTVLTSGLSHIAFRVKNLESAIEDLDKHKVKWISEILPAIGGGRLRTFEDPDGNMLQIVERI